MKKIYLKQLRAARDMTQAAAAAVIGCNRQYYANVENGKIDGSVDFWQRVKKAFDITDADAWRAMTETADKGFIMNRFTKVN